jgi:hypothetical protein
MVRIAVTDEYMELRVQGCEQTMSNLHTEA